MNTTLIELDTLIEQVTEILSVNQEDIQINYYSDRVRFFTRRAILSSGQLYKMIKDVSLKFKFVCLETLQNQKFNTSFDFTFR